MVDLINLVIKGDLACAEVDFGNQCIRYEEEIDPECLPPLTLEMKSSIMVDSDHRCNLVTGKLVTGLLGFFRSTPIGWWSKRQASMQTAVFVSEFMALKRGIEEVVACRYYLRSFRVMVSEPAAICTKNMSVLKNTANLLSVMQKKDIALAYQFCRE